MFDDFIELDLLDASDPANAMFASFYLGDTADIHDDNDINNLTPVVDTTPTTTTSPETDASSMGLVIKTEPSDSPMLLTPIPLSPQQTLASDESPLIFDTDMALITPDQLTIAPQATTVSPSSLSTSTVAASVASTSTAAATASPASTHSVVAIDSAKTLKLTAAAYPSTATTTQSSSTSPSSPVSSTPVASTSTAKRASPEPATTPARKHAKTDSVSSSKAKSSSASKKSSSSASSTSNAAAATKTSSAATAASSMSTAITTASSSATKGKSQSPEPTAESLTSTANTTLSAATLQFLLQQQVETPLIPQLFTGKLTREEIEETLARLLESTKHLITSPDEEPPVKIKEEPMSDDESDNEMEGVEPTSTADGAEPSHGLKTQPGIKTDDIPSSTDLKKMTSKERRQLRNKISAQYIYTLEGQVLQHKTEARHLREAVTLMQDENQRLKDELDAVRRQLEATTLSSTNIAINTATFEPTSTDPTLSPDLSTPLSKENQSLLTSIMNRNVNAAMNPNAKSNITLSMARPQSPILTPNLHKDVPNSSSGSTSQSSWKDKNPIMVHRTLIPEICFGDEFQFDSKPSSTVDIAMMDRPWMTFDPKPTELQLTGAPFTVSELVLELMQTFACMSASMLPLTVDLTDESAEADSEVALDWELQQNLWALTQVEEEDEMTEEQIQLVYDLVQCQASISRPLSPMQEDPNMLDWLYESMMARLVDLDLQDSQHSTLPESHVA
ncbi:hypothetical protein BGW39_003536 [Mortierella sp. 14UC]|nr:hypothetical protein BGW39_003536 [Mortierella sp. 14UC]